MNRMFGAVFVALLVLTRPAGAAGGQSVDAAPAAGVAVPSIDGSAVGTSTPDDELVGHPRVLAGLYLTSALLQSYDGYSTIKATSSNHAELNPVMAGLVGHPALVVAVKVASSIVTIAVAENLWRARHHPRAITMMASNVLMAWVAGHNALALRTPLR